MTICERFNNIKIKHELQEPELVGKNHMYSGRRSIDPIYQYIHYFFFTKGGISVWIFIKKKNWANNIVLSFRKINILYNEQKCSEITF